MKLEQSGNMRKRGYVHSKWKYLADFKGLMYSRENKWVADRSTKRASGCGTVEEVVLWSCYAQARKQPEDSDNAGNNADLSCQRKASYDIDWQSMDRSVSGLVAWHTGGTPVFRRRTLPVLQRSICNGWVTTYVGKPSVTGQPSRPTQPFILSGSINE